MFFLFKALKVKGEAILDHEVEFESLLADCAYEIRNGFLAVFPKGLVINCNYHVQASIEKRAKQEIKDVTTRKLVLRDIKILQLSQSKETFQKGSELLIAKWNTKQPAFMKYFEDNFVKQRSNWYEGFSMLSPSTNNALESTNGKIKLLFTNKRRVSMQEMKTLSAKMVKSWSQDLQNEKPFVEKVSFVEREVIDAYLWNKNQNSQVIEDTNDEATYWVAAEGETELTSRMIRTIKEINYNSFEKFKENNFRAYKVIINDPIDTQKSLGFCTCKCFFKNFKCIHTLGVAIRMGDYIVSSQVKQKAKQEIESKVPMPGKKRTSGRPKNATPALSKM